MTSLINSIFNNDILALKAQKTKITEIPEDTLVHIFSFLDDQGLIKTERVCKDWHVTHLKYSTVLDNVWQVKWFNDNDVYYVKDNISWKQCCSDRKKWIAENSSAHLLNSLSTYHEKRNCQYDTDFTVKKLALSVIFYPVTLMVTGAIFAAPTMICIQLPIILLSKVSNLVKNDFGTYIDSLSKSAPEYTILYPAYVGMVFAIYESIVQTYKATEGMRINCRNKIRNQNCTIL